MGGVDERKKERKRHRQTLRGLTIFPFLATSTPPFLLSFTFLTPPTPPPPSGICFRFEPVQEPYLCLISARRQKTESSVFPCIRLPGPWHTTWKSRSPSKWVRKEIKQHKNVMQVTRAALRWLFRGALWSSVVSKKMSAVKIMEMHFGNVTTDVTQNPPKWDHSSKATKHH